MFRILRLLKMLTWIRELNVILHAIASSARALLYVIMLLCAFFFHFGIAGVFLFADNDPQHFGSLWKAFVTLFQVGISVTDHFHYIIAFSIQYSHSLRLCCLLSVVRSRH